MRKIFLLGIVVGGAAVLASAASAATVNVPAAAGVVAAPKADLVAPSPALGKLAAAAQSDQATGVSQAGPGPAGPRPRRRSRFFGLPLLFFAAAGAGGYAIADTGDSS